MGESLLEAAGPDPAALCTAVTEWGRAPGHALCIEATGLAADAQYAQFAVTHDFARWLKKRMRFLSTERQALHWLRELLRQTLDEQRRGLAGVALREYTMWATFNPPDGRGDPVDHLPREVRRICECLALVKRYRRKDLLVLCYRLPAAIRPHIPTVATVACGHPWAEYWQPSGEKETYGRTQPYSECPDAYSCPEVVHEPVNGECLVRALYEIR